MTDAQQRAARDVWMYTHQATTAAIEEIREWCSVNKDDHMHDHMMQRLRELSRSLDVLRDWIE